MVVARLLFLLQPEVWQQGNEGTKMARLAFSPYLKFGNGEYSTYHHGRITLDQPPVRQGKQQPASAS